MIISFYWKIFEKSEILFLLSAEALWAEKHPGL